jgi:hypothetical protein
MTRLSPQERRAIRQRHIDDCRAKAIRIMATHPHGQEAVEGGYYTEMIQWPYHESIKGRRPASIPKKLLEGWKAMGEWRKGPGLTRAA